MKNRKKRNISEEGYWKSATDIMAGILLVIILVVMLLLLLLTQMNDNVGDHDSEHDFYYEQSFDYTQPTTYDDYHKYDNVADPNDGGGGGGGGGGEDDPGTETPVEINPDIGHDKTAVLVTAVDEETGNAIKKEGTLFELYANRDANGGLLKLNTYYPEKIEYKQYKTTKDGTFYLPEKITKGWYSFHNLTAPEGYGTADDFPFEITEPLDWPEPYLVKIPFSPSKNNIYVSTIDASTKRPVGGVVYEVYASEDIVTLDGTVRFKSGQKVDEFQCDANGNGSSKKLYLGKYFLTQKTAAQYYARLLTKIDAEIKLTDTEKDAVVVECTKTRIEVSLTDEFDEDPIEGAVYNVTDKGDLTTDKNGKIIISDLDKDKAYVITPKSLPELYRMTLEPVTYQVDKDGNIAGEPNVISNQTTYMIRLSVDVRDMIFKNSVSSTTFELYNSDDELVEDWDSEGEAHEIEGLEPGAYTLQVSGHSPIHINVKDVSSMQKSETYVWTLWDTILTVTSIVILAFIIYIIIRIVLYRKKKKANGQQKDSV